jgi:hypothetical protein
MAVTYTIDGDTIDRVDIDSVELVEQAEAGSVGSGRLVIDDVAGTIVTVGHKDVEVTEDDCSAPLIGAGFVATRSFRRGTFRSGASRKIELAIQDLNELLNRRIIKKADGKRPPETVGSRLHWLLGSEYLSGLVADNGFVDYPSVQMDRNDYTNSRPGDVLADMAVLGDGRNYFVYADPATDEPSLWFRNSDTSTDYSSTLRISNVLSDVDWATTFPAGPDATLERDPDLVFSMAAVPFARGTAYETKASTEAAFVERDGVAPTSTIKTAAKASRLARRFLNDHDHEQDSVNDTILVTSSKVGLIHAGMRLEAKYSHFAPEGYDSFTWYRVLERRLSHVISPGGLPDAPDEPLYKLGLRLSPQLEGEPSACSYEATEAQTFYPLGGSMETSHSNPSDGVVQYARPGIFYATVPTPGADGVWHFPLFGAGGAGTIDYAGDCAANQLRFVVVGPGTLTVQTEIYGGSPRPMAGAWGPSPGGFENSIGTFTSGDAVEFVIDGECANVVILTDGPGSPCGGKWGWSVAHWEAA